MATFVLSHNDYNTLPTLGKAIAALELFQRNQDLMVFGEIFLKHGMQDTWALSLIHRHFDLKPNEIMLEQPSSPDKTIMTKPVDVTQISAPYVGSNYRFRDGKIQPYEYHYGSERSLDDDKFLAFLDDLEQKLRETNLSEFLGLSPFTSTEYGIETNHIESRESIIEFTKDDRSTGDQLINTLWAFPKHFLHPIRGCRCPRHPRDPDDPDAPDPPTRL